MSPSFLLLFLLSPLYLAVSSPLPAALLPSSAAATKPTAYEVLQAYDFPIGLLPVGVLGYDLDAATGKFSAYLNGTCSFTIDGYDLRYQSTITGVIARDRLSDLKGVSVKVLFFWINIIEVTRQNDQLEFSVGILSADFPIDNFSECPQCGCGIDCVNDPRRTRNPGKSSKSRVRFVVVDPQDAPDV